MRPLRITFSGVLAAVLLVGLAGCGEDDGPTSATQSPEPTAPAESVDPDSATEEPAALPAGLASALEADGVTVAPTAAAAGELTEKRALRKLAGGLGPEFVADGPAAYLVEVVASDATGLAAGDRTWLMHLPGVGSKNKPDLVVLLDATSGADLASIYLRSAA